MTESPTKLAEDLTASPVTPDHDPHFEPIIKLPEISVPTNEEQENLMLNLRAKLYRFDSTNNEEPEWKDRGTGEVKLLHHKDKNTVRIVMRRDKTLKVCANHFITPWMELKPSANSDRAFVYLVAADFSDEEIRSECLAIKFATTEAANIFKDKFNDAKKIVATKNSLYINDSDEEEQESDDDDEEEEETPPKSEDDSTVDITTKLSELNTNSK